MEKKNERRRLIFLDIDGTLTPPGSNEPPKSALEAINGARKNGHLVFLCTGRNYSMLSPLLKYGFDGVVGSSGGYVEVQGETVYDCPLPDEDRDRILDILRRNNIFCTVETKNGSYTDEGFKEFLEANASENSNSELLRWRRQIESSLNILPMKEYDGSPAYKIVFMCVNQTCIREPKALLENDFALVLQDPDAFGIINGEITGRGIDKGKGVAMAAKYLGMDIEDTVGYGDSMNDLEMIEQVGLSVCMANGSESLKEIADEICLAVDEDGLCRSFRQHGWY